MVEVTIELTDTEYKFMQMYNGYIKVKTIKRALDLSEHGYNQIFTKLREIGLIVPRGPRKRVKRNQFMNPKYYTYNNTSGYFSIWKGKTYYACVKTEEQAKRLVELLKECDWDKSMVKELKAKVIE